MCGFESLREHQLQEYPMRRNIGKNVDPIKYLKIRIELLTQERRKNDCKDTHMILDKSIIELSIILDLLEQNYAKAPL